MRANSCRRGWTLIETVVCMTIGALIFATAVEILGFAMHSDSSDAHATESLHSLDRLAEQFTSDVRGASNVESKAPGKIKETAWTMTLPDSCRIDYALQDHALLRTAYQADKVVERDVFPLGDDTTARLDLQPNDQPIAALILEQSADDSPPPREMLRINVPIGWNHRFAPPSKNPG